MPNYVRNLIRVVDGDFQAIADFMKSENYDFDFNRLIPMPPSMVALRAKYNGISNLSKLGFEYWSNPSQRCKKEKYAIIDKIKEQGYDLRETLREGLDRLYVYADCGYWNSLEWAVAKWGTKWNAFDVDALSSDRTIFFNTAWSAPIPIYKALAKKFPKHKIVIKYYDEGGFFAGYCNIKDGDELGEDYECESAKGKEIINEIKEYIMKASAWNKASELAAAATITDRATYEEVRQACIDAIKWQAEQDKLELDAKDESIIQMEMTVFERVQSVCRYRCARFGDTYKCAKGANFASECDSEHCPLIV